jgi:hypothetical protein
MGVSSELILRRIGADGRCCKYWDEPRGYTECGEMLDRGLLCFSRRSLLCGISWLVRVVSKFGQLVTEFG